MKHSSYLFFGGIVTYALGIQKNIDENNYQHSEYIMKCSKGISDCYNGYYNLTLGKMKGQNEESDRILKEAWDKFYIWYMDLLGNYDDICGKALDTPLAMEIICFVVGIRNGRLLLDKRKVLLLLLLLQRML